MSASIRFLSTDDVMAIQQNTLAHEGGGAGLRDAGLLESAVQMPQQQFGGQYLHDDLGSMAAAYLFHIAANHPFLDGNKRAAALSALVFIDVNGVKKLPSPQSLERATLAIATGKMDKQAAIQWMRDSIG